MLQDSHISAMEGGEEMRKAEIDTTAPFRSVKEAVMMFGETVLGAEVYGTNLKQMQNETIIVDYDELEEAKQTLRRAREESIQMATSLFFLQQELQQTKTELQRLKGHEFDSNGQQMEFQKKKYVTFADPPCIERVITPNPRAHVEPAGLRRQASIGKKKMKQLIPLIKRIFFRKRESSGIMLQ
ncbi:WEB family protein [Perilla frutescens var. hirtella]|uniref:WEB family protein n=1 Tax=Perilla frutescens var. hirtella TaxID=608512 RepID=A0AAD4IUM1_PERFH|nr:WEB family protein [Perilla frutescens var. hirtella]